MSNYVLNIEKFSHSFVPQEDDMITVLEGFSKAIMNQVDSNMMKARHFTQGDSLQTYAAQPRRSPQKGGSTFQRTGAGQQSA